MNYDQSSEEQPNNEMILHIISENDDDTVPSDNARENHLIQKQPISKRRNK